METQVTITGTNERIDLIQADGNEPARRAGFEDAGAGAYRSRLRCGRCGP
jgi:hypothetical protein